MSHLAGIDLNLLPLLDALLAERQLTRAAQRVGLSQPAASRALGRLRVLLGDALLVRAGAGFALTPRAESLREPVRRALALVEAASRRARHALVAPGGQRGGYVDEALERMGKRRRVSLLLPHFMVMPFVIASSDLVVTLAERVARVYAGRLPVKLFAPPLVLPRFTIGGYWHGRAADDPALVWLRAQTRLLGIERKPVK